MDSERRDDLIRNIKILGTTAHVAVVADAVCSRAPVNLEIGLAQARRAGAVISATETVVLSFPATPIRTRFAILESC